MDMSELMNSWVDGFVKEAASVGLSDEQIQELYKAATVAMLSDNPDFVEGYEKEMEKAAWLGKAVTGMGLLGAGALASAGVGAYGYSKLKPKYDQFFMTPEQQMWAQDFDKMRGMDPEMAYQYFGNIRNREQSRMSNRLKGMGFKPRNNFYSGGYSGNPYSWN